MSCVANSRKSTNSAACTQLSSWMQADIDGFDGLVDTNQEDVRNHELIGWWMAFGQVASESEWIKMNPTEFTSSTGCRGWQAAPPCSLLWKFYRVLHRVVAAVDGYSKVPDCSCLHGLREKGKKVLTKSNVHTNCKRRTYADNRISLKPFTIPNTL